MDMYTLLYLKWITNKDRGLYSTGNSAQCDVTAWMGEEFGGEWIHIYIQLTPFPVHLKPSLIGYTSTQNALGVKQKKKKIIRTIGTDDHQLKLKSVVSNSFRPRGL